MITKDKLNIYKKYSGDIDMWTRTGRKSELKLMNGEDWGIIDELLQNLELIEKGLTSDSYGSQTLNKLNELCDSEGTKQKLKSMVGKY